MINYVKVDGFKSLIDFKLVLNTGLNILVGPNGSGKTNVISFFDFLGNLQEMTVSDEILKRSADTYRRLRNTSRFLLSNLDGFEPAKDMLEPVRQTCV